MWIIRVFDALYSFAKSLWQGGTKNSLPNRLEPKSEHQEGESSTSEQVKPHIPQSGETPAEPQGPESGSKSNGDSKSSAREKEVDGTSKSEDVSDGRQQPRSVPKPKSEHQEGESSTSEQVKPHIPQSGETPAEPQRPESGSKSNGDSKNSAREKEIDDTSRSDGASNGRQQPSEISGRRGQPRGVSKGTDRNIKLVCPDLMCRKIPGHRGWDVFLQSYEESSVEMALLDGEPVSVEERQLKFQSLRGRLEITLNDGSHHEIALFDGKPLIFKLPSDWKGEGRRIRRITSGHFIVFTPTSWQRIGTAQVESQTCNDPGFSAHYFYRDSANPEEQEDGFTECPDLFASPGIQLEGRTIFDNSDEGHLFIGSPPNLKPSETTKYARVGEECHGGWGENFSPREKALPKILAGESGRFFLRVYDTDVNLIDSVTFRYLPKLERIYVNGSEYTRDTTLLPLPTGHIPAKVRLVDDDGKILPAKLPEGARQTPLASGEIEVAPKSDVENLTCNIESDGGSVNVIVNLPRLWWRLEYENEVDEVWQDKHLVMTRELFQKHAYSGACLSLLFKNQDSVQAGFDHEIFQRYLRKKEDKKISIPLYHFVDHAQIDNRNNSDVYFNVAWGTEIFPLIVIPADPAPQIVQFTVTPHNISAGREAVLKWVVHNTEGASVSLEPEIGVVESSGVHTVCPTETTRYTLRIKAQGLDDISSSAEVSVNLTAKPNVRILASVLSYRGRWRTGKGFSSSELQIAGLTRKNAERQGIPIDKRRRSSHLINIDRIRNIHNV